MITLRLIARVRLILTCLAMIVAATAPSTSVAQRQYQPTIAFERDHSNIEVQADGTYVRTREVIVRIESLSGIEQSGVQRVAYSSSRMEVESVEAQTIQPDGERIEVPQASIQTKEEASTAAESSFSDMRYKLIIFPKVRVGSRLRYLVKIRCREPQFLNQYLASWTFHHAYAEEDFRARIILPQAMKLQFDLRGVKGGYVETRDERSSYVFTYSRPSVQAPEAGSVEATDHDDRVEVSTFSDQIAYARAYQERARPMAAVTEPIRAKAIELTRGLTSTREKVRALHHWVASNIRYISVAIGNGGLVPRSADSVLANLYGDCKDHVVLLEAMLDAVGIESSPALINMGESYRIARIGSGRNLNHVITYVPALDLYIDSTDRHSPFGTLPFEDLDKPVLLTALDRVGRTPTMKAQENRRQTNIEMSVRADGSIAGTAYATMTGVPQSESRSARAAALGDPEEGVVRALLDRFSETGTGTIEHSDPNNLDEAYWIRSKFLLDPLANVPGPAGIPIPVGLAPGTLRWKASIRPLEERRFDYPCRSESVTEHYTLRFAPKLIVTSIPASINYSDGPISYRATYRRAGQVVDIRRELNTQFVGSVCSKSDHQRWKRFHTILRQDSRAQIVYK